MRVVLIFFALTLLGIPCLKIVSALLLWIGVKLLLPELVIKLMDRFPIIITLGGMLLGWIAGGMLVTDPAIGQALAPYMDWLVWVAPVVGALIVLAAGKWQAGRAATLQRKTDEAEEVVEAQEAREANKQPG